MVFVIVNIADAVTSYFISELESNPIYLLTGSMIVLDIFKVLLVLAVFYFYNKNIFPSHFSYFMLVLILTIGSLAIGLAAYGNYQGAKDPQLEEMIEYGKTIPKAEKLKYFVSFSSLIYILPIALSLVAFKLYHVSLDDVKINEEYFKKRKWWQF